MRDVLFQILGMPVGESGEVVGWSLRCQPAGGWLAALAVLAAAAVAGIGMYAGRSLGLTPGRRRVLGVLRVAGLAGIAAVLLRPALHFDVEGTVRQTLALVFDASASMALRDPRTAPEDRLRAGIAEGTVRAEGGVSRPAPDLRRVSPSRLELLRAVVTNRELALLDRLGRTFDLKAAGFDGDLRVLSTGVGTADGGKGPAGEGTNRPARSRAPGMSRTGWEPDVLAAALAADGRETAPGTALREVLERERGRPLAGVVMFTDGIRNAGADLREAAARAREAGVAVHFVGLGTTTPRDLHLVEVAAQDVGFVRDEVPVTVRLRARGFAGETVPVALTLGGAEVERREVRVEGDGDLSLNFKVAPQLTGDFELAVDVPAKSDEILVENNRRSRRLRVVDDRIRVLLLEQSARWEFRYLQALLLRDRRVELKCVLFDGDPAIARDPGSPYLDAFPNRREDLFGYDLILFGDIDPKHFTPAQLETLAEFVSESGGSFLMLAGRRFSPWSYRDTALDRLLPVEFDRAPPVPPGSALHDRPLRLVLTGEGAASPLLRLAEDPAENLRRWDALPPLFWVAPVLRAKPAAQVLVGHVPGPAAGPGEGAPTAAGPAAPPTFAGATGAPRASAEPLPVVALQQYGVGQSMFVGSDNLWRWRRNEGEQYYVAFWGRIVQRLAIGHLVSGSRRTRIALDRPSALPGERVGVTARVFSTAYEPVHEPSIAARVEAAVGGKPATGAEVVLRAVPDQSGVYRGEVVAGVPGRYRLVVGGEAMAAADFTVDDRLIEAGETALQDAALREAAVAGGGQFFREEDLHRLPEAVRGSGQRVRSRRVAEIWSSPAWFLAVLALFGAEWVLRKLWQLK